MEKQMVRRVKFYGRIALSVLVMPGIFGHPILMNLKAGHVQAGESDAGHFVDFAPGEITYANEKERIVRVKDKEYRVLDTVSITDVRRNAMEWKDLNPSTQILFHLKQGRIDQIIILLPS